MIITTDPFYDINTYNSFLKNLRTKEILFSQYIHTKTFEYFLDLPFDPVLIDYRMITRPELKFLVRTVKPLDTQMELRYLRRTTDTGPASLRHAKNDIINDTDIYLFKLPGADKANSLSLDVGKIYYLGKYYNNLIRVYASDSKFIPYYVQDTDILYFGKGLDAEMYLNQYVFKYTDRLRKFSQTPRHEGGKMIIPKNLQKQVTVPKM